LLEVACVVGSTRDLAYVHMETGQQHGHFLCLRLSERSKPSSPELHEENTAALNNSPCKELYPTNMVHIMPLTEVPLDSRHQDLNFIPAYISAFLCAQYVLARHPQVTSPVVFCISLLILPDRDQASDLTYISLHPLRQLSKSNTSSADKF
jgi:hypothetical protein